MSVGVIGVLAVEVIEWVSNSNSFSILENLSISFIWAPLQIRRVVSYLSMDVWSQVSHWSWKVSVGVVSVFTVEVSERVDNSWCLSILKNLSINFIWAPLKI